MVKQLLILLLFPFLVSCSNKKASEKLEDLRVEMMDADRAFSKQCENKGLKNAFLEFIDTTGVLLRPNNFPLTGGNAIDYICRNDDSSIVMTWEPKSAAIAASGDMGYTYGLYAVRHKLQDTITYGTYVSIWKKQPDGKWKFILDTGNDGIEEGAGLQNISH